MLATGSAREILRSPGTHLERIVADSSDRIGWLRARSRGITATDVAKLSTPASIDGAARAKIHGTRFSGNSYTEHGKVREPEIARWMLDTHGIPSSSQLFHAASDRRHLATPDGVLMTDDGTLVLAEIKTTAKPFKQIPRSYLRQVYWQQYVLGAERTLFVWEEHDDFVPVAATPEYRWIERDEDQIGALLGLAGKLIETIRRQLAALPPEYR